MILFCSGVLTLFGWPGSLSDICLGKSFDWFEAVAAWPDLFDDFHWWVESLVLFYLLVDFILFVDSPCCLGAVDRDGAEEVCIAACGCSGTCYCACVSAHDALAAVYAAKRTCTASCCGASVGVSSRVRVPNREQHTVG